MSQIQALWFEAPHRAVLRTETLADPPPDVCGIQALFSAVSPGTERLILSGGVPPSLYQDMRCPYMGGQFPFPVKYGYSLVGRIIAGPRERLGQVVHVMHPHQNYCLARSDDALAIPEEIPPQRATLASNLETALNAVWDARVSPGERALVVGFGAIGSLLARLLSLLPGVQVQVADIAESKTALALKMGFSASFPEQLADNFDLAFHASDSPGGLQTAIDNVGFEGRVIELSWHGLQDASLQLGSSFHSRRKTIISSQVSHVPEHLRSRWDVRRRRALVFDLLRRPEFDQHITDVIPFRALPNWFSNSDHSSPSGLAYIVQY